MSEEEVTGPCVEYLVIVDQDRRDCKTEKAVRNLLSTIDNLEIDAHKLKYPGVVAHLDVKTGDSKAGGHRYIVLHFRLGERSATEKFEVLLGEIRTLLQTSFGRQNFQELWNDISREHASAAYPRINGVENLMRRLFTRFMVVHLGGNWTSEGAHEALKESVKTRETAKSKKNLKGKEDLVELSEVPNQTLLYQLDFIDLSDFLFHKFPRIPLHKQAAIIEKAMSNTEINLEELKRFVPRSNWELYFSKILTVEEKDLEASLTQLYDLRNCVAHNRGFTRGDLTKVAKLCDSISATLESALRNFEKLDVPPEDKEAILLESPSPGNNLLWDFIQEYNSLVHDCIRLAEHIAVIARGPGKGGAGSSEFLTAVQLCEDHGLVSSATASIMRSAHSIRNRTLRSDELDSETSNRLGAWLQIVKKLRITVRRKINSIEDPVE